MNTRNHRKNSSKKVSKLHLQTIKEFISRELLKNNNERVNKGNLKPTMKIFMNLKHQLKGEFNQLPTMKWLDCNLGMDSQTISNYSEEL